MTMHRAPPGMRMLGRYAWLLRSRGFMLQAAAVRGRAWNARAQDQKVRLSVPCGKCGREVNSSTRGLWRARCLSPRLAPPRLAPCS